MEEKNKNFEKEKKEEINKLITNISFQNDWDTDLSVSNENKKKIEKKMNNKAIDFLNKDSTIDNLLADEKIKSKIQKRLLREKLNSIVKHALYLQIVFLNLLIGILIVSQTINFEFFTALSTNNLKLFVELLKMYVGATIVELISLLGYIIKKVFQD